MNLKDLIYDRSPVFGQNFYISMYGLWWKERRFGGDFKKELKSAKLREEFIAQKWTDYQTIILRKILVHAFEFVPYYRKKFTEAGINLSQLRKFEIHHLSKLPILEKNDLRKFGFTSLLSTKRGKGMYLPSSGSTGTPVNIFFSRKMHQQLFAIMESRVFNWAGLHHNMGRGMIGGRKIIPTKKQHPPFYRYNFSEKQVYFSAYHISPDNVQSYSEGINKHKPEFMTGYAKANYFLAELFNKHNVNIEGIKAVVTSSETLTDRMRKVLSHTYNCEVFDSYSGVEACGFISETENHEKLISPDVGIIEILDHHGQQVKPGETGEAICTGLLNFDQPLIRYRIGDVLSMAKKQNTQCGREMPIIDEIVGRIEDVVVGPDGRKMVRFHSIYSDLSKIIEGQVIQEKLDVFLIKLITSESLTLKEKEIIISRMENQLGNNIRTEIIEVSSLPREKNGKLRSVISHV